MFDSIKSTVLSELPVRLEVLSKLVARICRV